MRPRALLLAASLLLVPLSRTATASQPASPLPPETVAEIRAAVARADFDGAIALAERLVADQPSSSAARLALGRVLGQRALKASLFAQIGWGKKCKKAFEEAVALDPENLDARFELSRYYAVAPGIAGGSHDLSRKQVAEIAKRNGARGLVASATLKEHEKDLAGAEAEFWKAAREAPSDPAVSGALASFLVRQKRPAEAVAFWRTRAAAAPSDLLARYGLARAALAAGTGMEEAEAGLRAYLAVPPPPEAPSWADAHWRLATVLEKQGRKQEAIRELQETLRLVPGHAGAKRDLDRLAAA